jgi:DmsE family decaheme c-type cytochrome
VVRREWLCAGCHPAFLQHYHPHDRGAASIPGAEFVGTEKCSECHEEIVRDFRTATHSRLKAPGPNAQNMGASRVMARQCSLPKRRRRPTLSIPANRRKPVSQCHLEVRAQFQLPPSSSVLEGRMNCSDCHNPHKGNAIKSGGTNIAQSIRGGGMALLGQNDTCAQCHSAQRGPWVYEHEALRQGCVVCHSPHGSVNQRLLNERNATLCLKCHIQEQTEPGKILIGDVDHSSFLQQGTCWSAGCHESRTGPTSLRYSGIDFDLMNRRALLRARTAGFAAGLVCAAIWTGHPLRAAVNADGTEIPDAKSTPAVEEQPPEYKNWIEFAFGGTTVDGDRAQFEQAHRIPGDQVFGGISDLHFEQTIGKDVEFKLDGHAIFDTNDYGLLMELTKAKLGYVQVGYNEFRTWYDGNAGYFRPNGQWFSPPFPEMHIDRGEAWIELGLRAPDLPEITVRYTHEFRDGQKDSTMWGDTNLTGIGVTRKIAPVLSQHR